MTPLLPSQASPDAKRSFESVYRAHVRDVYGFSLGLLGNAEDAEDVTQTTFLNAYRALERGEDVRNLRAWLLAIAHNVCRQRFRTAARRPKEVELDPESAEAFVDEDAPTATEIRSAMRQLSFNQRTVLVLREIEGLSYEEIAQAMGVSLSAVETLLFRARRALREQLEAAEHDLGCHAVERLISLQLDGKLSRQDKGLLRAHLRTCAECARFARSQRARKRVMPSLVAVPLPAALEGGFGAGAGVGVGAFTSKVAAVAVSAALVGTGALVESGVIKTPGKAERARAAAIVAAPDALPDWTPAASVRRMFDAPARKAEATPVSTAAPGAGEKQQKKEQKQQQAKKKSSEGASAPAEASTGGATAPAASASPSGGGGGTSPLPPPLAAPQPPTVPDVIGGAQDKVPPPPVTIPIAPPSLPPVEVPDPTGVLP